MNESIWLRASNPSVLLDWLHQQPTLLTPRLERLLAAAYCRRFHHRWIDSSLISIYAAEAYADDYVDSETLHMVHITAIQEARNAFDDLATWCSLPDHAFDLSLILLAQPDPTLGPELRADLIREVIGNPFLPLRADPACRTRDVIAIAEGIYARLDYDSLPILADALEDADCQDEELLQHLRGYEFCRACLGARGWQQCDRCNPGRLPWDAHSFWVPLSTDHCRGCWALDWVLGKRDK